MNMEEAIVEYRDHLVTYAAIDIGSNAVRLLIKQLEDGMQPHFTKVLLLRVPLRLGFDVFSNGGRISDRKRKDLVRLMKSCRQLMKIYNVSDYRACATSAMRDASNRKEIIKEVVRKTGINIEIIDGQEEARMIYNNHIENIRGYKGNYMYVGTVRMLNDSVSEGEWMRFRSDLEDLAASYPGINIIGSGGNINKLYKLIEPRDRRLPRMSVASLKVLHERLKSMSVRQRMDEYGLKADRADVIVPAGEIFLTVVSLTGASYIYVPVIGLSDGIIDGLYTKHLAGLGV